MPAQTTSPIVANCGIQWKIRALIAFLAQQCHLVQPDISPLTTYLPLAQDTEFLRHF